MFRGPRLGAWVALVAGLAAAATLWALATEEVTQTVRLTGHGFATYEYTETSIDPLAASLAAVFAVAGVAAWGILLRRSGFRFPRKWLIGAASALGAIALTAGGSWWMRSDGPARPGRHLTSIDEIVVALDRHGIECRDLKRLAGINDGYWRASARCQIPSEFGVPDGFDDVSIHLWNGEEGRQRWLADPANEEVDSVASPFWLVTCEFIATCMDVREALGGELNVEY